MNQNPSVCWGFFLCGPDHDRTPFVLPRGELPKRSYVVRQFRALARFESESPENIDVPKGVQSASVFAPRSRPTFARCRISAPPKPRPRNGFSTARDVNTATVFLCISMPPHATMRFPRRTNQKSLTGPRVPLPMRASRIRRLIDARCRVSARET